MPNFPDIFHARTLQEFPRLQREILEYHRQYTQQHRVSVPEPIIRLDSLADIDVELDLAS